MVLKARAAQTEQIGLQTQRKLTRCSLHQTHSFLSRQSCNFFLSQATWVVNLPISAYNLVSCCSWARFNSAVLSCFSKRLGSPSNAMARQVFSCVGWTSYSAAICASVFSSLKSSCTTRVLKAAVYCFLIMLEYILFQPLSVSKFLGPLYLHPFG